MNAIIISDFQTSQEIQFHHQLWINHFEEKQCDCQKLADPGVHGYKKWYKTLKNLEYTTSCAYFSKFICSSIWALLPSQYYFSQFKMLLQLSKYKAVRKEKQGWKNQLVLSP